MPFILVKATNGRFERYYGKPTGVWRWYSARQLATKFATEEEAEAMRKPMLCDLRLNGEAIHIREVQR